MKLADDRAHAPITAAPLSELPNCGAVAVKDLQCRKIRQLKDALIEASFVALDEQAWALSLSRSTAWTVMRGTHKGSGLSATIVSRMLNSPNLPPYVRTKVLEYVEEKSAGLYGHAMSPRRKFVERLTAKLSQHPEAMDTARIASALSVGAPPVLEKPKANSQNKSASSKWPRKAAA